LSLVYEARAACLYGFAGLGGSRMEKFIVKARRIAWHEDEVWAADADAAKTLFLKQWTQFPDYCPSTEVDDELDRIDIEGVE